MKVLFGFVLFCLSGVADISTLEKECYEARQSTACNALGARYRATESYDKAFDAVKKSCELMDEFGCSQMQSDSLRFAKSIQNEVFVTLNKKCEQKEILCASLASYYEDKNDYKNAILYAKKAFKVSKTGNYPYLEYKFGNRKIGYKVSAEHCELDRSSCGFYIRYMPSHPSLKKMVAKAKEHCLTVEKDSFGATTCSVLGTYFESRKRYDESVEMWRKDCERSNKTSCTLLIASKNAKAKDRESAYRNICERESKGISPVDAEITGKYCDNQKDFVSIPDGLLKIAQSLLTSFLDQQK